MIYTSTAFFSLYPSPSSKQAAQLYDLQLSLEFQNARREIDLRDSSAVAS